MRSAFLRHVVAVFAAVFFAALSPLPGRADEAPEPEMSEEAWDAVRYNLFGERPLEDGAGLLALEMPARADDAAIVPVTLKTTLPVGDARSVRKFWLVIDENPAPLAGAFAFGPSSGVDALSTRVRINAYTHIHGVAELSDGKVYVVKKFIRASGGCGAPAPKDSVRTDTGAMKLKRFGEKTSREMQIMIRHPNNSGFEMDPITRSYVPANYIEELKIWQGENLLMSMSGAISISQDPNVRFTYRPNGAMSIRAEARDTNGASFKGEWAVEGNGF